MSEGWALLLSYAAAVLAVVFAAGWGWYEHGRAEDLAAELDAAYLEGFDDGSHDLVVAPSGRHAAPDATVALRVYADEAAAIFGQDEAVGEPWTGAQARVDALAETYYRIMKQTLCHACGSPTCPAAGRDTVDDCPVWQDAERRDYWLPTIPGQLLVEGTPDE